MLYISLIFQFHKGTIKPTFVWCNDSTLEISIP